jgi:hypothetical protein
MWKIKKQKASEFTESESFGLKRIQLTTGHAYIEFSIQDEASGTIHKFNTSEPRQGQGTKLVNELLKRYPNRKWTVLCPNIRSASLFAKLNEEYGDIFYVSEGGAVVPIDRDYAASCYDPDDD